MERNGNKGAVYFAVAVLCALPVQGLAAMAGTNTVNSAAIVDGAVATADLANLAVTSAKIANGAVSDAKILGPISASKLGAHSHSSSDITGTINISKIPVGTSASTVAAGNHNHDSAYQNKATKIAIVAQSGGDYANPAAALSAVNTWCGSPSATNPCKIQIMPGVYNIGSTSINMQSYVDIAGSGENVTKIVGNYPSGLPFGSAGTIVGANNAELSNITIEAVGMDQGNALTIANCSTKITNVSAIASGNYVRTVYLHNSPNAILTNVSSKAIYVPYGGGSSAAIAFDNYNSSPVMRLVTADVQGGDYGQLNAIHNWSNSSPIIENASLMVSGYNCSGIVSDTNSNTVIRNSNMTLNCRGEAYGTLNYGSTPQFSNISIALPLAQNGAVGFLINGTQGPIRIENSSVSMAINGQSVSLESGNAFVSNTRFEGGQVVNSGGTLKCFGVFDGNLNPISCQ